MGMRADIYRSNECFRRLRPLRISLDMYSPFIFYVKSKLSVDKHAGCGMVQHQAPFVLPISAIEGFKHLGLKN